MRMTAGQEIEKIETRLRHMGTKLNQLESLGTETENSGQHEYRQQINNAKDKHTAVREKLQKFRNAGGQKWDSFKGTVELAWQEFEQAFRAVRQGPVGPPSAETEGVSEPKSPDGADRGS
jgi:hypothetical protein